MAQTTEEKRAYARGYNRCRARGYDYARKLAEIAKGYRDRLADMKTDRSCQSCRRWSRGGRNCQWGTCAADFQYGIEPRMWSEKFVDGPYQPANISTSQDFGCVNWLPLPSSGGRDDG